jgi:hypothetical protein
MGAWFVLPDPKELQRELPKRALNIKALIEE